MKLVAERLPPPDAHASLTIARALARSEEFHKLSGKEEDGHKRPIRTELSDYLRRCWLGAKDDKKSTGQFPIPESVALEIGAAIERGGRYTDSLFYYEQIMRRYSSLKHAASLRWIACKEYQARNLDKSAERSGKDVTKASSELDREKFADEQIQFRRSADETWRRVMEARREMGLSATDPIDELPVMTGLPALLREILTVHEPAVAQAPEAASIPAPDPAMLSTAATHLEHEQEEVMAAEAEEVVAAPAMAPPEVEGSVTLKVDAVVAPDPVVVAVAPVANLTSAAGSWWPSDKLAPRSEWSVGDFRIVVIRKTHRINIEHRETGETVSILQGGREIQSDWEQRVDSTCPGIVRFDGVELWLDLGGIDHDTVRVGFARLGIAIQVNLAAK